jgi:hypothetical protein
VRLPTICVLLLFAQQPVASQSSGGATNSGNQGAASKLTSVIFDYLTMAGADRADFRPLTQGERNQRYLKSLTNPVLYFKAALSGAIDHANDKPEEWGQGASGYGKRVANILGQYGIQRTVTFGLSSALHEDNRYFGSGKKGFWRRTGYAVENSFLARHDNGKQYPSISLVAGFAAAAFGSRGWQPPSTRSMGDGAVSFGYSMGYNVVSSVAKEFLPDIVRPLVRKRKSKP